MINTRVSEELKPTNQENQKTKQIQQQHPPPSGGGAAASPPSASSSPSHEFSFTISLHPTNSTKAPDNKTSQNPNPNPNPNANQNPFAIDLTPADEIFFHGHLLPLHLLSHLPVSPRSSTNSIDTSLPINKESLSDQKIIQKSINHSELDHDYDDDNHTYYDLNHSFHHLNHHQTNSFNIPKDQKPKSKSFSLFGLPKWKKGEKDEKEKQRKLKFDVSQVVKRYMRMVRPFLSFRSRKNMQFHRQSYSLSGNLSFRGKNNNNGSSSHKGIKRGAYSAPVSMKNSPTNSGLLVATPGGNYGNSSSSLCGDSTMEELQAAIQAAIAHCKKSSSMEEKKIKCQENEDIIMK